MSNKDHVNTYHDMNYKKMHNQHMSLEYIIGYLQFHHCKFQGNSMSTKVLVQTAIIMMLLTDFLPIAFIIS